MWNKDIIASKFSKQSKWEWVKLYAVCLGLTQLYQLPSPPPALWSGLPAIGWEQGREAKEENPQLNLGSDEWVAVQDASLLDVWGDADTKKGNAFSHRIFTGKVSWMAAYLGLHLLVRLLKVLGGGGGLIIIY